MIDLNKLPDDVLTALNKRGLSSEEIAKATPEFLFTEYCEWHGLIRWGSNLLSVWRSLARSNQDSPKWTRITDDPDTWPPLYIDVLVQYKHFAGSNSSVKSYNFPGALGINDYMGGYWRPLCSIDYPPEDTHE